MPKKPKSTTVQYCPQRSKKHKRKVEATRKFKVRAARRARTASQATLNKMGEGLRTPLWRPKP